MGAVAKAGVAAVVWGIAVAASAQVVEYYHVDAVGSVRALTSQAGQVIERHDYLPFGEECTTGPCASNPRLNAGQSRKYTGKERDKETGLDYFGARYYGSKIGRFTTTDPVYTWQENLVDPQRWNRYAYARNNPLRYVDPDGRAIETPWDALNVGLGVAALAGNVAAGNIGGAALDAVGLVYDVAATAVPGLPGGASTAIKAARAADKVGDAVRAVDKAADAKTYITYTVRGAEDQVLYVGRASGQGTPAQVLAKRASSHQHKGAGRFNLEDVQSSRASNRGAEDVLFNRERLSAQEQGRTLLNKSNPISDRNPRGRSYVESYAKE